MADKRQEVTAWIGWGYFAACLLVIVGFFQMVMGLAALVNDEFYVALQGRLLLLDFTTWGWVHLGLGLLILLAGMSLFAGSLWARVVAILLAGINLVAQFAFLDVYPVWSLVLMAIDVLVIYALTVHGAEMESAS